MLKPHVLSALGFKLEEEGVVTPTVEAEVSASVEVTPEQQEAIDEAVTQIEEVATAGAELEEAVTQQEEVEEAEATLSAIADNLRTYGQLPQQMYDFLQKTGYLDVIAAAQSTAMNRVQYPAVESINPTALNRQVVDGIIAGCEAMLEGKGARLMEFLKKIWDKIVELWDRLIVFIMGNAKRIEALGAKMDALSKENDTATGFYDVSGKPYAGRLLSVAQAKTVKGTVDTIAKRLEGAAASWWKKWRSGSKDTDETVVKDIAEKLNIEESSHKTLGEAGVNNINALGTSGDLYGAAIACAKAMPTLRSVSGNLKKAASAIASAKLDEGQKQVDQGKSQGADMVVAQGEAMKEESKQFATVVSQFQKYVMLAIRSYLSACSTARSAEKKDNK